jgi:CysZ protein
MREFVAGAAYPFRALVVLNRTPELWPFVLLPILINLVVGALVYIGLLLGGLRAIDAFTAGLPDWAAALEWLLGGLLVVGLLVATGFLLVRFGVVLGSPFYGQISERLELARTGSAPGAEPLTVATAARDIGRALAFELKKLALTLAVGLPLLLLNLVPVAGTVLSTIGSVALGALIACLDFYDGPLERRRISFRRKLGIIRRSLPAGAGFGLVCLGLVSIPLINLLAIPLCVTAGTLFVCERLLSEADAARGR